GPIRLFQYAAHGDAGTLLDGIREQPLDAIEVRLVHDLRDAVLPDRAVLGVQVLPDLGLELLDQRVLLVRPDEHVVGADACLSAVELLGRREVCRELLEVCILVDDHRGLAAQLQSHGREVLRGGPHHDLSDPRAAGKDAVVERKLQQRSRYVATAFEERDFLFDERFANDLAGDARRGRAQVRQLDDTTITGRDGRGKRTKHQPEGEVPRPEYQAHAPRLVNDPGRVLLVQRRDDV